MQKHDRSNMQEVWEKLVGFGIKPMGSDNLQRAGEYLYQVMAEICDQVEIHQYQVPCWEVKDWRLEDHNGKEIKSYLFLESGSSEKFEGYVEFAGYHRVWDMYVWRRYKIVDAEGRICAYITVRENEGAIPQMLFAKSDLPHFMVGSKEEAILKEAEKSRALLRGFAETKINKSGYCRNLSGEIGEGREKVILCAHYDTVYSTVGAYDNAAGTAVVLETARQLTRYGLNKKIEILLTDGEEFNLKGARFRAAEERGDISFVLNIDGVGREDILEVWCGPETFERKVRAVLDKSKEKFIPRYICPPPPGSDHAPFYEKGIPVCMLTFNDQGILHTPEDIIEKSKLRNMEKMVRLNLELLERIGVIQRDTN